MRSFSVLDTYDPSANSTGSPYKESIMMTSPVGVAPALAAVFPSQPGSRSANALSPPKPVQIGNDRPGYSPGRSGSDFPDAVWSANWDGLVAAAVARCGRALLLEALA